jgi:hypothetical protein
MYGQLHRARTTNVGHRGAPWVVQQQRGGLTHRKAASVVDAAEVVDVLVCRPRSCSHGWMKQ